MHILYYGIPKNEGGQGLRKAVESVIPIQDLEVYRSLERLFERLRRTPGDRYGIAVFLIQDNEELFALLDAGDLWGRLKIVLVLNDPDEETISLGHALYPRYVAYASSEFRDVRAVLGKMLQQAHENRDT
jgi:hypothetical protein